jgi:hypothetical protein
MVSIINEKWNFTKESVVVELGSGQSKKFLSSPQRSDLLMGIPSLLGIGGSFPKVKRLGREAGHSPPSGAELKCAWMFRAYLHSPKHLGVVLN